MKHYSQYKQDYFIDFLFKKKQTGIFLDIGAYDGVKFSNTYFFEKHRNWNGICIEPNPVVFKRLKANRICILENCCISNEAKNVVFRSVSGNGEMLSGILDFFDEEHIQRINNYIHIHGDSYSDISVKCENINYILENHKIYNIDYCSIDTEGADWEIIKSIDFEKIRITSFSIEGNNEEIAHYLQNKGYKCVKSELDTFYVNTTYIHTYIHTILTCS
jgi:FkbM family methyltransferase